MVKTLILLAAVGLAPGAKAGALNLNCGSPQGFQSHGRYLEVKTEGRWESLGFGHTRLSYQLQYAIDCGTDGECWAAGQSSGPGVVANQDYRPNRYRDYQQFAVNPLPSVQHGFLLMPEALPDVASSFRAYAMLGTVQGEYGATVPLHCEGKPVTSFSSTVSESAVNEISRANQIIHQDFGFASLNLLAEAETLQKEIEAGTEATVSVSRATQLALAVIFDSFEAIEAPLNIAALGWAETSGAKLQDELNRDQKSSARAFLREQMQNPETSLALHLGGIVKGQNYPPEQGESVQDNWIFVLRVPTLSDHLYWVIVDRKGRNAPYVYGFN